MIHPHLGDWGDGSEETADAGQGGQGGQGGHTGLAPVLDRSSTFALDEAAEDALARRDGVDRIDTYGRFGTSTTRQAGDLVARLEGAEAGLVTASGMAAISSVFHALVPAGGRIVASEGVYGGTDELLDVDLPARGVTVTRFDAADPAALETALAAGPADLVWCEAISNPRIEVPDLRALAGRCEAAGVPLGVDATFAGGMAVRPVERGASLVVHSATKFLNGHSDVVAGVVCGQRALVARAYGVMTRHGGCVDPMGAWLLIRGLRTLPVRWARQSETAGRLAKALVEHPAVQRVFYPGLDPEAAARLDSPGAMLSFELADWPAARRFLFQTRLCTHATSLGGVETLVSNPARSSHATLPPARLEALGITPGLVRVSVGLEDFEDLWADMAQARSDA